MIHLRLDDGQRATILTGKFVRVKDCQQFNAELGEVLDACQGPVVLDFSGVTFLSSACLAGLIHHRQRLRLVNVCPEILELFTITRLNEILSINESDAGSAEVGVR